MKFFMNVNYRPSKQSNNNFNWFGWIKTRTALSILICLSSMSNAQIKNTKYTNQQWIQYYNKVTLSSKWSWLSDGGFRFQDWFAHRSKYIIRTGIGHQLKPNLTVTVGIAHLGVYHLDKIDKYEIRPYQEILIKHLLAGLTTEHRCRMEARYFTNSVQENRQTDAATYFRVRYRFLLKIPFLKLSSSNPEKKWLWNIGNEVFIQAGCKMDSISFDQNRILLGTTIRLNNNFEIALTYNHQLVSLGSQNNYRQDQIVWLSVIHSVDLTG